MKKKVVKIFSFEEIKFNVLQEINTFVLIILF